jgi:hypothetical protein
MPRCNTAFALIVPLLLATLAADSWAQGDAPLRSLDAPGDPYRSPLAGEGFRTNIFGREVTVEPRDRRSVSAWDAGLVSIVPRVGDVNTFPFASLYFWRRPDDDLLLRAVTIGLYNDIYFGKSTPALGPFEGILTLNSLTPPAAQAESIDGEKIDDEELYWGQVRPGIGFGYRESLASPGHQDNMLALSFIGEPGFLYSDSGHDTAPEYIEPQDTFEGRLRLMGRLDLLERNLLELPHRGLATGCDLGYGYRADWDDWGIDGRESGDDPDYVLATGYIVGACRAPFLGDDRHHLVGSLHGGVGDGLDRFSGLRVGGGPTGEDYEAISRATLPGATLDEFQTERYAVAIAEYRWEPIFFTFLSVRGSVAYVDRERFEDGGVDREGDVLSSIGGRVTTGFLFRTRLQLDYNYNFGVVRDGDYGGHELVVHLSGNF